MSGAGIVDKEAASLTTLQNSLKTLEDITEIADGTLAELASNREKLNHIHAKTGQVNSDLDTSRVTLRQMEQRNKYWFLPSWLFR
jgi:hypothetical protein